MITRKQKGVFFHEDCKNVFRVRGCSINIDSDVMLGNDTIFMNSVITSSSNVTFSSECTFYNSIIDLYSDHPYISQNGIKLYNSEVNIESSVNDLVVTLHIYDIVNSRIKSSHTILLQIVSDKFKIIDIKNNIITCDKEVKIQNTLDGSKCPIFIIDNNYINGSNIFILSSNTEGIKQNIACSNNIFHAKYTSLPDKILLSVNNHTLS